MKKKANRLDAIKMIISSKEVGSQEELLQELNREGFDLPTRVPVKCYATTDLSLCSFPVTSPLSAPVPVMPAAWLMTSTTMNSVKFWEPLPVTIRSCWCCVKELQPVKYVSFCHSSFPISNNYTYYYIIKKWTLNK